MSNKARDFKGLSDEEKKNRRGLKDDIRTSGIGNGPLKEAVPNLETGLYGGCETKISGRNNTWIVLGRDRPNDIMSGYGAKRILKQVRLILLLGAWVI